ncbi:C39 family peptidase, partial [Bacillus cereus]|nr:C39 family peptidase [Bacillus cereus]
MKRFLTLYALVLILAGCSEKTPSLKKNELQVKQKDNKLIQNTTHSIPKSKSLQPSPTPANKKIILDVPLISQKPELKYGCEVTSLAMVLQ